MKNQTDVSATRLGRDLERLQRRYFKPGVRITFVARAFDDAGLEADVVITTDDLDAAIDVLHRHMRDNP